MSEGQAKIKIVFEPDEPSIKRTVRQIETEMAKADVSKAVGKMWDDFAGNARTAQTEVRKLSENLNDLSPDKLLETFLDIRAAIGMSSDSTKSWSQQIEDASEFISLFPKELREIADINPFQSHYKVLVDMFKTFEDKMPGLLKQFETSGSKGEDLVNIFKAGAKDIGDWEPLMKKVLEVVKAIREEEVKLAKTRDESFKTAAEKAQELENSIPLEITEEMNAQLENVPGLLGQSVTVADKLKGALKKVAGGFKNVTTGIRDGINGALATTLGRMMSWAAVAGVVKKIFTAIISEMARGEEILNRIKKQNKDDQMKTGGAYTGKDSEKFMKYDYFINKNRDNKLSLAGNWNMMRDRFGGETSMNEMGQMEKTGVQRFRQLSQIAIANDSSGQSVNKLFQLYDQMQEQGSLGQEGLEGMLEVAPDLMQSMMAVSGMTEAEIRKKAADNGLSTNMVDQAIMRNTNNRGTIEGFNMSSGYERTGPSKKDREEYERFHAPGANPNTQQMMDRWLDMGFSYSTGMLDNITDLEDRRRMERGQAEADSRAAINADRERDQQEFERKRKNREGGEGTSLMQRGLNLFNQGVNAGVDAVQSAPDLIGQGTEMAGNFFDRRKARNERNKQRRERAEREQEEKDKQDAKDKKEYEKKKSGALRENERAQRDIDRNEQKMADLMRNRMDAMRGSLGKTINIKGLQSSIQDKLTAPEDTYEGRMEALQQESKDKLDIIAENSKKFGFQ